MKKLQQIKELISKGNTEEAISGLLKICSNYGSHSLNEVILLSGQFQQWKNEFNLGISDSKDSLRRIEYGIVNLIDKISEEINECPPLERTSFVLSIEATFDLNDKDKIDEIIQNLIFCSQDYSINARRVERGSIRVTVESTLQGYEILRNLHEEGNLDVAIGYEIIDLIEQNSTSKNTLIDDDVTVKIIDFSDLREGDLDKQTKYSIKGEYAKDVARKFINNYSIGASALTGALPIPGIYSTSSTIAEIKLVSDIAKVYGLEPSGDLWKEMLKVIMSNFDNRLMVNLFGEGLNFVPLVGWVTKSLVATSIIRVRGEAVIQFFENLMPNQVAYSKPRRSDLERAFGDVISKDKLELYLKSY